MTSSLTINSENHIVSYSGPEAVQLYSIKTLSLAIEFYVKCKMIPTQGMTITKMLASATRLTHKHYSRGQGKQAIVDLKVMANTLLATIDIVRVA